MDFGWPMIRTYVRYAAGLPGFLRNTITLEDARRLVREGIEAREENFLLLVRRGVYGHPGSPYHWLLRRAGCEYGDLLALVRRHGLEDALRTLRAAGVYVSFEEMKGRAPIVRGGQTLPVTPRSFHNPCLRRSFQAETGGSTGAGVRVDQDLDHLAVRSAHLMLAYHAYGALHLPFAVWRGVLPDGSGINNVLSGARHGRAPQKWFSPSQPGAPRPALRFQAATYGTVLASWLLGAPLPWPEMVPISRALHVAQWAAGAIRKHGGCQINAPVSRALRVCVAAREAGLDLTGAVFVVAGEPATPAKTAGIRASGARCYVTYGFAEAGRVAIGCANPSTTNDLHLLRDAFAVFPFERQAPGSSVTVEALNITTLLLTTPQILINAEIDDYGAVEERSCGCPLEQLGYRLHVRDIYSYRKLTGEGVTLAGSEMIDILERVLPARFGGSPLDYQLIEEEDEQGFTRLTLAVSPRAPLRQEDEPEVLATLMRELAASSVMAGAARSIWAQAGALRLKRIEPVWTGRGKLLPLHLASRSRRDGS